MSQFTTKSPYHITRIAHTLSQYFTLDLARWTTNTPLTDAKLARTSPSKQSKCHCRFIHWTASSHVSSIIKTILVYLILLRCISCVLVEICEPGACCKEVPIEMISPTSFGKSWLMMHVFKLIDATLKFNVISISHF